uniref:Uncharacterized protein n=1 Tax=Micrurus spixii TaxID=129469 RepID=A0A2D4N154_9SAUR
MQAISDWMLGLGWNQKVTRDHASTLMNQLVEGMLSIGSRFAPHDWSSIIVHTGALPCDVLPIRLHIPLLKVSSKAVHVLVIGQQRMSFCAVTVDVPDPQHRQQHGDILLQGSRAEVIVHPVGSSKQFLKIVKTNMQSNGKANGRPQRVTSTNPIPELKHVCGVNSEVFDFRPIGREGSEMLGHSRRIFSSLKEPFFGSFSICDGFLSGKSLGGNDEEHRLRIQRCQSFGHVSAIDVGYKPDTRASLGIRLQRFGHHEGPQVRPTNANVDHVCDGFSCVALPVTATDFLTEILHLLQYLVYFRNNIFAFNEDWSIGAIP